MKLTLDTDRPIFLQIKEGIENDILKGVLKPDEQIPSTSRFVSLYQINPVTVLKGVNLLTDEGILYKKRGVGIFVSPDAPDILQKRFHGNFAGEHLRPMIQLAIPLGITREELHEMIDRIWDERYLVELDPKSSCKTSEECSAFFTNIEEEKGL